MARAMRPTLFHALALMTLVWLVTTPPTRAEPVRVEAQRVSLTEALVFATGTSATPEVMVARYRAGGFSPEISVSQFEANHAPERWAAVELTGPPSTEGRVLIDVPMASEVDLYLVRDGAPASILSFSLFRDFDPDQHRGRYLASAPLALTQGETALLLAHVKFGPFRSVDMVFASQDAAAEQATRDFVQHAAFYAFAFASILFFVAFFAALESWNSLLYAVSFFVALLLIAFFDGHLHRFAYPNMPQLQQKVGFFLIFLLAASSGLLAAYGFQRGGKPLAARLSLGLSGLAALGFLASLLSPGTYVAGLASILLAVSFIAVVLGTRALEAVILPSYHIGRWMGVVAGVATAALLLIPLLSEARSLNVLATVKAVYLVALVASLVTFIAQVKLVRRAHDKAVAAEIGALEREAQVSRDLLRTEQEYTRAQDLARKRRQRLATASHDLRQPLMSLRMTVDAMANDIDPETRARLSEAFDYISDLSGSYLDEATGRGQPAGDGAPPDRPEAESYPLSIIVDTVWQMFHEEAEAKGMRLRRVPSSLQVNAPALVLMRIASNLVSNAVKHADRGGVLIGVRRKGGQAVLTVVDNGPGMTDAQLDHYRQEGVKGAQSQGHGLGLALCYQLAAENGLALTAQSTPDKGTVFSLTVPRANGGSTP